MSQIDYTFKLCVIGDPGVGKTSTVGRFVYDGFETHQVTVGAELESKVMRLDTDENVQLIFWDVAGTARMTNMPMARRYFQGCHCLVMMYSVIEKDTFDTVLEWLQFAQKNQDASSFEPMIVLVGNKCDMDNQREVSTAQVKQFAQEKNFSVFMETSAKQGTNIAQLFESVCKELIMLVRDQSKAVGGVRKIKPKSPAAVATSGTPIKLTLTEPSAKPPPTQSCSC